MSRKNFARAVAKQAVGDAARVDKIQGRLRVSRLDKNGKLREWRTFVTRQMSAVLPNWQSIKTDGNVIIFEEIKTSKK